MFCYVSFAFLVTRDPFGMTSAADCRYVVENISTETKTGNTEMLTAFAVNERRATRSSAILRRFARMRNAGNRCEHLITRRNSISSKMQKHIFVLGLQQKRAKNVSTSAVRNRI